jgi:hypothetical protein
VSGREAGRDPAPASAGDPSRVASRDPSRRWGALLIGNLDCEVTWTRGPALPREVLERLALLATTLRVLAPGDVCDDDVALWLPAPVRAEAVLAVRGVARPLLVSGALPRAARLLPWGALEVATAPPASGLPPPASRLLPPASGLPPPASGLPPPSTVAWREALWSLPIAPVAVARAASDRRLAATIASELGVGLSGSRTISTVDELRAHLRAGGADASPSGTWVVKAIVTSAGRERVRRTGAALDDATATRVARLLARHGALVFEPWLERLADVAIGGVVLAETRALVLPPHRPWCDRAGVVRGVIVDDGEALGRSWHAELARVAAAVAARLGTLGYRGGFVVDALVHRAAGGPRLQPLVEINPRLTFGLVARAWAERTGLRVLGLGGPPPPSAVPLVLDDRGAWAAWLADGPPADAPPADAPPADAPPADAGDVSA